MALPSFSLPKANLAEAVAVAARFADARNPIAAFNGVMIEAEEGRITLSATDAESSIRLSREATVSEAGQLLLPAKLLADVVRALPEGEVSVVLEANGEAAISAAPANFRLRTIRLEDFPKLPEPGAESAELPGGALANAVAAVGVAASADATRPILTGIQLLASEDTLAMAATDSYRLATRQVELGREVGDRFEALVSAKTLAEVARMTARHEGAAISVSLAAESKQILFTVGREQIASRLIEGNYPDWKRLMPERFAHNLLLERAPLMETVGRARLLLTSAQPLRITLSEGELTVSASAAEIGEASESIPAPSYSGEKMEIGFNAAYLAEGLKSMTADTVWLRLDGALRPLLLEDGEDAAARYLLMPLRLPA